jgi:hypothetical protein
MVAQMKIVVLMVQEVTTRSVRVQTISIFERDQYILMIMRDKIHSRCQDELMMSCCRFQTKSKHVCHNLSAKFPQNNMSVNSEQIYMDSHNLLDCVLATHILPPSPNVFFMSTSVLKCCRTLVHFCTK